MHFIYVAFGVSSIVVGVCFSFLCGEIVALVRYRLFLFFVVVFGYVMEERFFLY